MEKGNSDYITLNNGDKMPRVGFGTHALENCEEVLYESIKIGVRHIDTASLYGNEVEIGKAIQRVLNDNIVKRDELYVVTKIWVDQMEHPEKALKESLERLQLDYVDLYLVHWPLNYIEGNDKINAIPQHVLWPNMEGLVDKGLTKSIGVSNYNVQSLLNLFSFCRIKPVCNQIELHPYLTKKGLVQFCQRFDVVVVAYNSLCRGAYTKQNQTKELNLLEENMIKEIAEKYQKTTAQIALNWALSNNCVVIPKSTKLERTQLNLEAVNFTLSLEDLAKIDELNINYSFNDTSQSDIFKRIDIMA